MSDLHIEEFIVSCIDLSVQAATLQLPPATARMRGCTCQNTPWEGLIFTCICCSAQLVVWVPASSSQLHTHVPVELVAKGQHGLGQGWVIGRLMEGGNTCRTVSGKFSLKGCRVYDM
jgi:hypothetical protein